MSDTLEQVQTDKRNRLVQAVDAAYLLLMSGMEPVGVAKILESGYGIPVPEAHRLVLAVNRVILLGGAE